MKKDNPNWISKMKNTSAIIVSLGISYKKVMPLIDVLATVTVIKDFISWFL
ncbi:MULTISPECIES: hypothetical protein [Pontibacillus]|uniref:Uncharacterized protein n=1 Tax=Pontibacillus chungwhensis TaxID=265426 RepID=A0ABY8UVS5_9BACI|nr:MULTISPECIES: hypothetical protein [Pontibacillus]MCD5324165.1 hypothetical protein [Pontibacillus sp. HN14]WIF97776.1 hypothetical protein QNI29_18940 [Pontibacillus chungwhensis]